MKADYKQALLDADAKGYAIPAFNCSDCWEMQAVAEAAAEKRAVVYLATNMRVAQSVGLDYLYAMAEVARQKSGGHVILHLDHSNSVDLCKAAVDSGYQSVMIDASMCSLEENIRQTREVVEYAHRRGAIVEAEIGRILGRGVEGTYEGDDYLVHPADAVALAESTGVDSLAVGIGTAHGFYNSKPHIDLERLRQVNRLVSIPLVLHGGTGVPFEVVKECIKEGMAKVNVGTQLHATYIKDLKTRIDAASTNISDLMEPVKEAIKPVVAQWIEVCKAANRY